MSSQTTSRDLPSVTSSPALAAGPVQLDLLAGLTTAHSGQDPAPVSPSPLPGSAKDSRTSATCGPNGSVSSRSAALQSALESRLRARLRGSPECAVIWKPWITPWGQSLWKPRARVLASYEIVFGLWPACQARDHFPPHTPEYIAEKKAQGHGMSNLNDMIANFALWPAMSAANATGGQRSRGGARKGEMLLSGMVIATWPTCAARDWKNGKASQETMDRNSRPLNEMVFSIWSALRATDGEKDGPNQSFGAGGSPLPSQVAQTVLNGSSAPTGSSVGSLHPEFAGWEMGYPPEWLSCAPSETPSTRKRPRK